MSEEILINVTPQETRVAVVEHGVLQEVFIERANRHGLVGNIYKGVVSRVLPGMQAAFIDVGLERTAFLHASDVVRPPSSDEEPVDAGNDEALEEVGIADLLREGQEVLVQVIKDPLGTKGARLTTHISLPSRYLVYMPQGQHVGVSIKIDEPEERNRLRELILEGETAEETSGGYIVRTAAEGAPAEAVQMDKLFLNKLWASVRAKAKMTPPRQLVHGDLPLVLRILRDLLRAEVEQVRVDSEEAMRQVETFSEAFFPHLSSLIHMYQGERPIFDLYGVEDEISKALERKVPLKSGGYVIFDQTEAMTTVDVNTGAYVGYRNLEETIFKTNLEAAQTIARQLRLRNLGGIIILDFIDMQDEEHKTQVLRALAKSMEKDHARSHICEVSQLGLVEMTRKRTRESLEHVLCEPCPTCTGKGSVRTAETICYEVFREIMRAARQFDAEALMVISSEPVNERLLEEESNSLAELEAFIGKPIRLQAESQYLPEQYDVVVL